MKGFDQAAQKVVIYPFPLNYCPEKNLLCNVCMVIVLRVCICFQQQHHLLSLKKL